MTKKEKIEKRYNSLVYSHLWLKYLIEYGFATILTTLSSAIFAFGVNVFLKPTITGASEMVSGGSSGLSQVITKALEICGVPISGFPISIYSVLFVLINTPLIIFSFRKIGKRFSIFTLLNVALVFVFTNLIKGGFIDNIAQFIIDHGGMIGRSLFAGVCTGVSSAIAYKIDSSAGGFDIISYYVSEKKSTSVGKYSLMINISIIIGFAVLTLIDGGTESAGECIGGIFFSSLYLLTCMLVIDTINVRNKKTKIEIVTTNAKLPQLIIANVPHGATVSKATGAYSGKERLVVTIVVATNEAKKVVNVVKKLDPESFIEVTTLQQVYGNFHLKHVK